MKVKDWIKRVKEHLGRIDVKYYRESDEQLSRAVKLISEEADELLLDDEMPE